ncbi:hypothetical protein FNV43_RR21826 [Rhamnella rubrinervis]|uniref:Uncharacterized protein n=1 Tax=Rhamnella rubrinervis TaxID=2594499 RepID=A0A8K0GRH7_9ROSA|nr:hypothetical protein FNV43_RR21826 [Rhamnella rubrinervis]
MARQFWKKYMARELKVKDIKIIGREHMRQRSCSLGAKLLITCFGDNVLVMLRISWCSTLEDQVWGYETFPSLVEVFGTKSIDIDYPRLLNWTISRTPSKSRFEAIFHGRDIGAKNIDAVKRGRGRHQPPPTSDFLVASAPAQSITTPPAPDVSDAYRSHSPPGPCIVTALDEEDGGEEFGGGGVDGGDAQRINDQLIDHVDDTRIPPVSISSSPIAKSKHNVKHIKTVAHLIR